MLPVVDWPTAIGPAHSIKYMMIPQSNAFLKKWLAFQRKIRTGDEVGFEHYAVNECPSILTFFAFIVNNLRSIC